MDIKTILQEIQKPHGLLESTQTYRNRVFKAVEAIQSYNSETIISLLFPLLLNPDETIRNAAAKLVLDHFRSLKHFRDANSFLRYLSIQTNHFSRFSELFETNDFLEICLIASFNSSGYIREAALDQLIALQNPKAIPYFLIRLADWVPQVRSKSLAGIQALFHPETVEQFLQYFKLIEGLKNVGKVDLQGIQHQIFKFLFEDNHVYLLTHFKDYPAPIRFQVAKGMIQFRGAENDILHLIVRDKFLSIRKMAIPYLSKLSSEELDILRLDSSALIRDYALSFLKDQPGFLEIIVDYLTDSASSIRGFARTTLNWPKAQYIQFYTENLQKGIHLESSIASLGELNSSTHEAIITAYLRNSSTRIRKGAFFAITHLNENSAAEIAFNLMDDNSPPIKRMALSYLAKRPSSVVIEKARKMYETGNEITRIVILKFFNQIGGWVALPELMIATIASEPKIRQLGIFYLSVWKAKSHRFFTEPTDAQRLRNRDIYNLIYEIHEKDPEIVLNPLHGFDFFLR